MFSFHLLAVEQNTDFLREKGMSFSVLRLWLMEIKYKIGGYFGIYQTNNKNT